MEIRARRWVGAIIGAGIGFAWLGATLEANDVFFWLGATFGAGVGSDQIKRGECRTEGNFGFAEAAGTLGTAGVGFTVLANNHI